MDVSPSNPSLLVADVISSDGTWDLDSLQTLVLMETINIIRAIPLTRNLQLLDSIFWAGSRDGSFTIKSALDDFPRDSWLWIWKLQCVERIRMFVWLLVRGRVLTNSVCFTRHMTASPACPRCEVFDETPIHLLRDCYFAKVVWGLLGFNRSAFFTLEILLWIKTFSTPS
ncbi:hypothetical protein SLA2020_051420 [Shorea laevis]